ncbi:MAG: biotin-dependent carboxyltransferase family protein [Candidatus Coatesbacteria bacterium]
MRVFRVVEAGLLTTVQDPGRPGHRAAGVAPGGAFDPFALRAANRLCGNTELAAALEVTYRGPRLEALTDAVVAVCGADLSATADGRVVPRWRPVTVRKGSVLSFGARVSGCRAYLGVAGGLGAPVFMRSRATDVRCGLGGVVLAPGMLLETGKPGAPKLGDLSPRVPAIYDPPGDLRVIPGPDLEAFPPGALEALLAGPFRVHSASDRSGVRLTGTAIPRSPEDVLSEPVASGHIQVPPDGRPIILGPECGSIGGYPRIACLIAADLPRLAQLLPNDPVRFSAVDVDEARWLDAAARALLEARR